MNAGRFRLLSPDDLLALPKPTWLIDGLVPAEGLAVLFGAPGSGKSFLALDWALSVASGRAWFGREVKQGSVVYVAGEGSAGLSARYRAWAAARGGPVAEGMSFLPEAVNLLDGAAVEKARRTLDALPERPGLLVVDTMARSMIGGDENATRDVSMFVAAVDELRAGNAALIVHHPGRDGKHERGSTALEGAADLRMLLRREKTGRTLTCEKLKDGPEWDPIALRLTPVDESCVFAIAAEVEAVRDELEETVLSVIVRIGPASKNRIAATVGSQRQAVLRAVDALDRAGKVRATPGGFEVVPAAWELPGNHLPVDRDDGGSGRGATPVGGPGREPPSADQVSDTGTAASEDVAERAA